MARSPSRLDPKATVLVTGANGFIGSTIVDILLSEGYNVRGTVRTQRPWLQELFDERHGSGRFESVVVSDLSVHEKVKNVLEGAQGVIHVVSTPHSTQIAVYRRSDFKVSQASDLSFKHDAETSINATKAHTHAVLLAAASVPTVRSFVLTSSASATYTCMPGMDGIVVREGDYSAMRRR
jgi:nucleoside-diphosphate-sugar epimerase